MLLVGHNSIYEDPIDRVQALTELEQEARRRLSRRRAHHRPHPDLAFNVMVNFVWSLNAVRHQLGAYDRARATNKRANLSEGRPPKRETAPTSAVCQTYRTCLTPSHP